MHLRLIKTDSNLSYSPVANLTKNDMFVPLTNIYSTNVAIAAFDNKNEPKCSHFSKKNSSFEFSKKLVDHLIMIDIDAERLFIKYDKTMNHIYNNIEHDIN
jgi:hypothetical protein